MRLELLSPSHQADKVLLLNNKQISFGPPGKALTEDNLRLAFGHIGHTPGGSGAVFMNTTENFAQIFFINRNIFFIRPRTLFAWFSLISNLATKIQEY